MATIGQALTAPETGWKRYDDSDSRIIYSAGVTTGTSASCYNSTYHQYSSVAMAKSISFKFYGTQFRIIAITANGYTTNSTVNVDGANVGTFTESSASTVWQALVFEKTGLTLGVHTVVLSTNDSLSFELDAIDINSTGYLVHPILNQVTSIDNIKNFGDCIPCTYTSNVAGTVGYFSQLGIISSDNMIPSTSSATPNGSFYWIYVGKDYEGRKKFIADRNIQNNVSWDTLNSFDIVDEMDLSKLLISRIPKMTSNTTPSGTAFCSSVYSSDSAWCAFDKSGTGSSWQSASNYVFPQQLGYQFQLATIIKVYSLNVRYINQCPKSWTFEASNDGTNWIILDTKTNITFSTTGVYNYYYIQNTTAYLYYRINVSVSSSTLDVDIGELDMYGYQSNLLNFGSNYNSYIRLLTGGTSSTDTDDEWDQIIVNSTLNNTISAGDNNVWNWNGIHSFMSTSYSTNTNRILRGNGTLVERNYCSTSNMSTTIGFRPVLLVESNMKNPTFSGNLLSSSIHNQDAILTGSIIDPNDPALKVQYKILVNDTQIYPTSGYTDLATSPVNINYSISNSLLTQTNNKITIIINNEGNLTNTYNFYATIYNNAPTGILTLSDITTHNDNITLMGNLTDTDLDQISYRILINGTEMSLWSTFVNDPYIDYIIDANNLNVSDNTITVEYKDNFRNVGLGTWSNTITRTNNSPIINTQYINGSVIGTITDPDNDPIQYRILVNGIQKYPEANYTDLNQICNINYQLNRNDILINQNNIITIYAKDYLNSITGQEISFVGDYIGLMFMDENQQFYTTDIGELLKYLDFNVITLGQITEPIKILVQNKFGFPIKDINLTVDNGLPNIVVELSKEENPFIANSNLILENNYNPNEIDYFHIRLNTTISQTSVSGTFKIDAKATTI